ncbi:unnamed protein product [Linum trigynum]|uniref:Uncharacterized protein n=1 Tax=Linum trigynum TaxID=586398 RepID=A0AAV2GV21_9ROSI
MADSSQYLHLGSVLATSFAKSTSNRRNNTMHLGPYITRIPRHFVVHLECGTKKGRTSRFKEEALDSMNLLQVFGPYRYIDDLFIPPELPPSLATQPCQRRCRHPKPPPPSSTRVGPSSSIVHL